MNTDSDHNLMAEEIPLLVGGGLPAERVAELRAHVMSCPGCARAYWDLVDVRDALLYAAPADPSPPAAPAALKLRLASRPRLRHLATAAALLLAFVAGTAWGPFAHPVPPSAEISVTEAPPPPAEAPMEGVERAYREALEEEDQLSRGMLFLASLENEAR